MNFSIRNKDGKAGVVIIILAITIIIALIPWYFIISSYFNPDESESSDRAAVEESTEPEYDEPEDEPGDEPDPIDEIEPDDDDDSYEDGHAFPLEDSIVQIRNINNEMFASLNDLSSEYDAIAVSLVAFDGNEGRYFTYEYGHADFETGRLVNADTKFRVASLAKLTTVICAMVLVDDGLLDLDADISVYLGYDVLNNNFPGTEITTRMLMQHTSSIFDSGAFQISRDRNTSESMRVLLERGSSFRRTRPGSHFEYSNFGYAILGAIIENASGRVLDTFAREVLFQPLGLDASYIPDSLHNKDNIAAIYNERHVLTRSVEAQLEITGSGRLGHDLHIAQGSLYISAIDYARILSMLGNGGILHEARILSEESVREIHNTSVVGAAYEQGLSTRFSFGDFRSNEGFFWHTGSAYGLFSQYMQAVPLSENRGVVIVTTGATTGRELNGMVTVCTELASIIWDDWDTLFVGLDADDVDE
ncbi:MAG: beta-lactamase family protein [Oscillospiraceae bacterium]|nr:beta-lactamase family protein [Oscillospiraceae bacterium]